jgi:hypothetical protein
MPQKATKGINVVFLPFVAEVFTVEGGCGGD